MKAGAGNDKDEPRYPWPEAVSGDLHFLAGLGVGINRDANAVERGRRERGNKDRILNFEPF